MVGSHLLSYKLLCSVLHVSTLITITQHIKHFLQIYSISSVHNDSAKLLTRAYIYSILLPMIHVCIYVCTMNKACITTLESQFPAAYVYNNYICRTWHIFSLFVIHNVMLLVRMKKYQFLSSNVD